MGDERIGAEFRSSVPVLLASAAIVALRFAGGYLLFHTLAELFSIVIAATFFLLAWHTRRHNENPGLVALGIVYIFVALLDVLHTLSFSGMVVFAHSPYAANQLWIVARWLQALGLLVFGVCGERSTKAYGPLALVLALMSAAGIHSILVARSFPACFVEGVGQTPFKVANELGIMAVMLAAALALVFRKGAWHPGVRAKLIVSIVFTFLSELTFTAYAANYDWLNMSGHVLKIYAFWLIYRSIVVTGLERPTELFYARLDAKRAALARSNESLSAVLNILSHDLKGPLSSIAGVSAQLAESTSEEKDGPQGALPRRLALITDAAGNALSLVERVLAWGRAQSGQLEPVRERVGIAHLVEEQLALLAEILKSKDLSRAVAIPEKAALFTDREMTATIIRNFIQNAVKFTPRGGHVRIRAEREGLAWAVSVIDDGVGMSEAELARLDGLGRRLRGVGTEGERGSGFGLVMCREFAKLMGGSIRVSSRQGEGSTFTFVLPAAD